MKPSATGRPARPLAREKSTLTAIRKPMVTRKSAVRWGSFGSMRGRSIEPHFRGPPQPGCPLANTAGGTESRRSGPRVTDRTGS